MKTAAQNWECLIDLACLLHQQNDYHEILRVVAQQAASLLQAEIALILMINPRSLETVKTVMREGAPQDERKFKARHHQISGWIMQNRRPLLCENIKQDARFSGVTWREAEVEAVLGVPLTCEGTLLGTLFLDEIANLPLHIQTKFMRVLEQNEVRPLGSNVARQVEVRVIAASSRSLRELMSKQLFREDLFYRLHVYPLKAPSLQERQEDIPLLAHHFLQHCARQQQKQVEGFHDGILLYMKQRSWPGNIRQLENFVERLVALSSPESKTVKLEDLPVDIRAELKKHDAGHAEPAGFSSLTESLSAYEAHLIRQALSQQQGNQSQAARSLRIPVQTLQYKMKKLGIAPTSVRKK